MADFFNKIDDTKHDRSAEINQLCNVIQDNITSKEIIYVYGDYHVGKSHIHVQLKNKINKLRIKTTNMMIDYPVEYLALNCGIFTEPEYDVKRFDSKFHIVNKLYKDITEQKSNNVKFPRYECARNMLYNELNYEHLRIDWNSKYFKNITKFFKSMIDIVPDALSLPSKLLVSLAMDAMDEIGAEKIKSGISKIRLNKDIKKYWEETSPFSNNHRSETTEEALLDKLTELFIKDLNEYTDLKNTRFVFILDTYEVLSRREIHTVSDWFYDRIIKEAERTLWIIFGNGLPPVFKNETTIQKGQIKSFSKETTEEFLIHKEITPKKIRNHFFEITEGLPGALVLLVDSYNKIKSNYGSILSIDDFRVAESEHDTYSKIFIGCYKDHLEDNIFDVLKYLACLQSWNLQIFHFIISKLHISFSKSSKKIFNEIINESFVRKKDNADQYFIIDLAKGCLISHSEADTINDIHYYAFAYYSQNSEQLLEKWEKNIESWNKDIYNELHHASENAVFYGCELIKDEKIFFEFCKWFTDKNGEQGFQQRLSNFNLYVLKRNLLIAYLNRIPSRLELNKSKATDEFLIYRAQAEYDLSWAHIQLLDYPLATSSTLQSLDIGLKIEPESMEEINVKCIYLLGIIYQKQGRYKEAESWHRLALMLRENSGNTGKQAVSLNAIGLIKLYEANLSFAQSANDDAMINYEEAREMFLDSEAKRDDLIQKGLVRKDSMINGLISVNTNLSRVHYSRALLEKLEEEFLTAKKYANKCIKLYEEAGITKPSIILAHQVRSEIIDFDICRFLGVLTSAEREKLSKILSESIKIYQKEEKEKRTSQLFDSEVNYQIVKSFTYNNEDLVSSFNELSKLLQEWRQKTIGMRIDQDLRYEIVSRNLEILRSNSIDLEELKKLRFLF